MPIHDFRSADELHEWLEKLPLDWVHALAMRSALRVVPLLGDADEKWLYRFALAPIRSVAICWIALNFPSLDIDHAIDDAVHNADRGYDAAASQAAANLNALASFLIATNAIFAASFRNDRDGAENCAMYAFETAAELNRDNAWLNLRHDGGWLTKAADPKKSSQLITTTKLWGVKVENEIKRNWSELSAKLRAIDPNYSVWTDWYDRRIRGERSAFDIPGDKYRKEDKAILRRLAEATNEDFWGKGHEHVNAELTRWLEEARVRVAPPSAPQSRTDVIAAIKAQASPQAQIIDGKLDAAPNSKFDKPVYSDDLADLPSQLLAIADVILKSLPRNCEPVVKNCFAGFRDELLVRGNRPILNIVKAMAASLIAELYGVPDIAASPDTWTLKDQREWGAGMDSMFASFFKGYHDLIHHFPMDSEREALIAATPIDEMAASGAALTEPINAVAEMIVELGKQGFATDNIVRIIEAHQLYTRDVAQLPPPDEALNVVTPKRRLVVGTLGFYLQSLAVVGSAASIYSLPAGTFAALAGKLKDAIDALLAFIR